MFIEKDCTITHNDHTYESGGAYQTPFRLVAYLGKNNTVTTWHGKVIGTYRTISSWRVNSPWSTHRYAIRATVDGIEYHGRSFGVGCIMFGKKVKTS